MRAALLRRIMGAVTAVIALLSAIHRPIPAETECTLSRAFRTESTDAMCTGIPHLTGHIVSACEARSGTCTYSPAFQRLDLAGSSASIVIAAISVIARFSRVLFSIAAEGRLLQQALPIASVAWKHIAIITLLLPVNDPISAL